jgi:hypothetical protein
MNGVPSPKSFEKKPDDDATHGKQEPAVDGTRCAKGRIETLRRG